MSEQYRWSAAVGRYVRELPINRRFLGNEAFLISLGVEESQVTGEEPTCGVSYLTRLAMLQPAPIDRSQVRRSAACLPSQARAVTAPLTRFPLAAGQPSSVRRPTRPHAS